MMGKQQNMVVTCEVPYVKNVLEYSLRGQILLKHATISNLNVKNELTKFKASCLRSKIIVIDKPKFSYPLQPQL